MTISPPSNSSRSVFTARVAMQGQNEASGKGRETLAIALEVHGRLTAMDWVRVGPQITSSPRSLPPPLPLGNA